MDDSDADNKPSPTAGAAAPKPEVDNGEVIDESYKTKDANRSHEGQGESRSRKENDEKLKTRKRNDSKKGEPKKINVQSKVVFTASSAPHTNKPSRIPIAVSSKTSSQAKPRINHPTIPACQQSKNCSSGQKEGSYPQKPQAHIPPTKWIKDKETKSQTHLNGFTSKIPRPVSKPPSRRSDTAQGAVMKTPQNVTLKKDSAEKNKEEGNITYRECGKAAASVDDEEAVGLEGIDYNIVNGVVIPKLDLSFLDSAPNSPETEYICQQISQLSTDYSSSSSRSTEYSSSSSSGSSVESRPDERRSSKIGNRLRQAWRSVKKICSRLCCCSHVEKSC